MSPQAGWILQDEIAPRIAAVVPRSIKSIGAEDSQELVQDGICMAAKMVDRLERQGKLGKVTSSNVAFYCLQHLKSGRRANGCSTVDIMGTQAQLNGSTKLHSMSEVVSESECGSEIFELHDVLSNDNEDPGAIAARRLDWEILCSGLTKIELLVVESISSGKSVREVCRAVKMTKRKLIELQARIAVKIVEVLGIDVLEQIVQLPQWRNRVWTMKGKCWLVGLIVRLLNDRCWP